jgi:ribosomal protein S8
MDMNSYQDEHDSTSTCFKLECNHAFHTKCIVECLQKTRHKCPSCNQDKDLLTVLSKEGVILELVDEVKKVESVKLTLDEFRKSKGEISDSMKQFKNDIKTYAAQRKTELKLSEKYKYYMDCQQKVSKEANRVAKLKGGKYRAAFEMRYKHVRTQCFEKGLFGFYHRHANYEYKHPRIYLTI